LQDYTFHLRLKIQGPLHCLHCHTEFPAQFECTDPSDPGTCWDQSWELLLHAW